MNKENMNEFLETLTQEATPGDEGIKAACIESASRSVLVKSLAKKLKGKFKYLPVTIDEHFIEFGGRGVGNISDITLRISNKKLTMSHSSGTLSSPKDIDKFQKALSDIIKNWKLIESTLKALV